MVFVFRFENHFSLYIVDTIQWEVLEQTVSHTFFTKIPEKLKSGKGNITNSLWLIKDFQNYFTAHQHVPEI